MSDSFSKVTGDSETSSHDIGGGIAVAKSLQTLHVLRVMYAA